jgi:hypothetical protein
MSMKNIFKKIAESKATGTGQRFNPAGYELVVGKLWINEGFKGATFICEMVVRKSTSTGAVDRLTGKPEIPLGEGSIGSFAVNLDNPKAKGSQYSNVKRFILGLIGADEAEVTNDQFIETLEELCGDKAVKDQPMRGKRVDLATFKTPKVGNPAEDFTNHQWSYVEQTEADIAAERAKLDQAGLCQ